MNVVKSVILCRFAVEKMLCNSAVVMLCCMLGESRLKAAIGFSDVRFIAAGACNLVNKFVGG